MDSLRKIRLIKRIAGGALVVLVVAGVIYCGMGDVFHVHETLELKKGIIAQQAEYEKEFTVGDATFWKPKVIVNPYKISPLTALVIFKTDEEVKTRVVIPGPTGDFQFEFEPAKEHYLPIYGLMPDADNQVQIACEEKNGGGVQRNIVSIKTDPLPEKMDLPLEARRSGDNLDNELYFMSPSALAFAAAYDISGNVRWYLTQRATWENSRLENGHLLVSTDRLVGAPYYLSGMYEIDLLGKVYHEWTVPDGYHHDYTELPNGNFIVATNSPDESALTAEDYLIELDRESGNIVKSWDLKQLLAGLDTKNTGNENWSTADWFHNNSVWYDQNTNSLTISGRHVDAVVNFDYDSGKINWIEGDKRGWPEEYLQYFLEPVGDLEWSWSQHAAMILPNGDLFVLDNGNNKSKLQEEYLPPTKSYTRGVIYRIDTEKRTIRQIWQYGKERGSDFYSPYISDVDYLGPNHYIVHSGGIVRKNGKPLNRPAFGAGADQLLSDTVEILNDQVIFELRLPNNYYRAEKMPLYVSADAQGLQLGEGKRLGKFRRTVPHEEKFGLPTGAQGTEKGDAAEKYKGYKIEFEDEEDRLSFTGTFKKHSNLRIVLAKGLERKYYRVKVTDEAHAAMCVSLFSEEENRDAKEVTVHSYINKEGLDGRYKIFVEVYDQLYDTGKSVEM